MATTSAGKTVEVLSELFARYGVPQVLVSDNGPQFVAQEFAEFMHANGINHLRGAPYHPATNGEAERFVQTFKQALQKGKEERGTLKQKLDRFLLVNRTAPHTTTGVPPAELFMRRQLRTRLDLLRPSVKQHVENKQQEQQKYHDRRARTRVFEVGQQVLVRNFRAGPRWIRGQVAEKNGAVSYRVKVGGETWKRHADQLLAHRGQQEAGPSDPCPQGNSGFPPGIEPSGAATVEPSLSGFGDAGNEASTREEASGEGGESASRPGTPPEIRPGTPAPIPGTSPALTPPSTGMPTVPLQAKTPRRARVTVWKQYPLRSRQKPQSP